MIETTFDIGMRDTLTLSQAILIYESQTRTTMTVHDIRRIRGKATIGPGRVPTQAMVLRLASTLLDSEFANQWVPPEVLVSTPTTVAWWEPPRSMPMFFATRDRAVNALSGRTIPQPALLFIADAAGLRVLALPTAERPAPTSPVALAPHYNLSDKHFLCVGSTPLPNERNPLDTAAWSSAYFASAFTHAGGSNLRHRFPGSYAEMLARAEADGAFNPDWLRLAGTLADIPL